MRIEFQFVIITVMLPKEVNIAVLIGKIRRRLSSLVKGTRFRV